MPLNPGEFDSDLEHRRQHDEPDFETCSECGEETDNESGVCDECEEDIQRELEEEDSEEEEDDD